MYNYGVARNNYLRRKIINIPLPSEKLAEFIGILYGDGGLTRYQVKVTFNPSQKSQGFSPRDECKLLSAREGASAFRPRGSTKIDKTYAEEFKF